MLKKFWDSIVQKAIESVIGGIVLAITAMLTASAALLQWTTVQWYWRRAAMAGVATVTYWAFIRFAPRWMVPSVGDNGLNLSVQPNFEEEKLYLHVTNRGPSDEFVASVMVVNGLMLPWPVFPFPLRWHRHSMEKREILKGATQHIELLSIQKKNVEENNGYEIGSIQMYSPHDTTELQPHWLSGRHLAYPLKFSIAIRSVKTEQARHMSVDVYFAAVGTEVLRDASVSSG